MATEQRVAKLENRFDRLDEENAKIYDSLVRRFGERTV